MSNQDERAVDLHDNHSGGHPADEAANPKPSSFSDFERVLQLIAAQVEDSERRQAELLQQVSERLARLETDPAPSAEDSSSIAEPSLDRVETSLARLAQQIANPAVPADENAPDTPDTPNAPTMPAEPDVWADNAADLAFDPLDLDRELNDWSKDAAKAAQTGKVQSEDNSAPSQPPEESIAAPQPDADAPQPAAITTQDSSEDAWSTDDAERLMQVCESEMFEQPPQQEEFGHVTDTSVPTQPDPQPAFAAEQAEPVVETSTDLEPDVEPAQAATPANEMADEPTGSQNESDVFDDRFTHIATRVEEALEQMRAHDPVSALRERFDKFHTDVTGAFSDVATRSDIESLKNAETQIEDLRRHFERVQDQLTRLDNVEKQLEAVMDRLSDDRLVTLLATNGATQPDQRELAAVIGEYVANRVSTDHPGVSDVDEKLGGLQDTLTSFIEEQRAGKDHQMGVLDTLQDAMVQVLDRVDALDSPSQPAPFEENPAAFETPNHEQTASQPMSHEPAAQEPAAEPAQENAAFAQYAPEDAAQEDHAPEFSEPDTMPEGQPLEPADELATMSTSAISAATAATQRHAGFEPFSNEVATSTSEPRYPDNAQDEAALPGAPGMSEADLPVHAPAKHVQPETIEAPAPDEMSAPHLSINEPADMGELPEQQEQPKNSVARLRQEFIVEAHRAKEQADALAVEQAQSEHLAPPKKGFSLFGFSIGGKSASAAQPAVAAQPAIAPHPVSDVPGQVEHHNTLAEPQLLGIPRSRVLIGAFILMITASGVLLMMPRSAPTPAPATTIERAIPQSLSTTPQPAVSQPVAPAAPAPTDAAAPDMGAGTQPKETKGIERDSSDAGAAGDRSEIIDPWSRTLGAVDAPGRPAVARLDGISLQTSTRPASPREIARLSHERSMAHWSLKLGDAASRATMAGLLPEYQAKENSTAQQLPALVSKTAVRVHNQAPEPTREKSSSNLDLPPASVGPLSLRLAAAKGDPSAEFEVGTRLAAGKGTAQNFNEAVKWYTRSASRGFAQSQYRLGTFYERGLGVKKDTKRARIWYRRAAEQGNTKAMHNLAVLSAGSASGTPDYTTAAQWFQKASDYGLADSQYNLAVLYENGLGVKQDQITAYKLYALAARSGDKDATKRRDALKAKFNETELAAAQSMEKSWRRKMTNKLANDAFTAGQAWKSRASNSYAN